MIFLLFFSSVFCGNQLHLAYLGDDSRSISWTSLDVKVPMTLAYKNLKLEKPILVNSTVKIWEEPQLQNDYRYIHTVILEGLMFNEQYEYWLNGFDQDPVHYFFDVKMQKEEELNKFVVYGDMGVENDQCLEAISEFSKKNDVDLIWHVGDLCYDLYENNGTHTDDWMNLVEPLAASFPYMVIPGNHESKFNFTHYESRYTSVSRSNPYYYSYDYGFVHVIHFTTEFYFYPEYFSEKMIADQYNFIKNDLIKANKNRKNVPWLMTTGHRPMYCEVKSFFCKNESDPLRIGDYGLEELFNDQNVDIEIWGHVHNYGRTFPLFNYTYEEQPLDIYTDPKFPVHVITGAAGNREDIAHESMIPEFVAAHIEKYSFSSFEVSRNEVKISQWNHSAKKPELLDQFIIKKTK